MAMTAGSVDRTSINGATGVAATSSGFAGVLYAWIVAYYAGLASPQPLPLPALNSTANPYSVERPCIAADLVILASGRLAQYQFWADLANMVAQVVGYVLANAHAHVTTQQLGVLPTPLAIGTPIGPPASATDIPIQ